MVVAVFVVVLVVVVVVVAAAAGRASTFAKMSSVLGSCHRSVASSERRSRIRSPATWTRPSSRALTEQVGSRLSLPPIAHRKCLSCGSSAKALVKPAKTTGRLQKRLQGLVLTVLHPYVHDDWQECGVCDQGICSPCQMILLCSGGPRT